MRRTGGLTLASAACAALLLVACGVPAAPQLEGAEPVHETLVAVPVTGGSGAGVTTTTTGGSSTSGAVATTPDGYQRLVVRDTALSIAVPRGWMSIDLTQGDLDQILAAAAKEMPGANLDQIRSISPGLLDKFHLFALDRSGHGINVILYEQPMPISTLKRQIAAQLSALGGTSIVTVSRQVAGVDALQLDADLTIKGVLTHERQLYVVSADQTFIVTVFGVSDATVLDHITDSMSFAEAA